MSTPQTSGMGEPISGTERCSGPKSTEGAASVRWTSDERRRGTNGDVVEIEGARQIGEELVDRDLSGSGGGLHEIHCGILDA